MTGFTIRAIIFFIGLGLFCVPIFLDRERVSATSLLSSWRTGLILIIVSFWMGSWRIYQCAFTVPDQIKIVGHIKDESNSQPNNYLVLLYLENDEIARNFTRLGKFDVDKHDKQNDGYFELTVPNTYQFSRCSMPIDFQQDSFGHEFLGIGKKTTYMWHNFTDMEAGKYIPINIKERNKKYTVVVLPSSTGDVPKEVSEYPTYLDPNGKVKINVPPETYTVAGNSPIEVTTNGFVDVYLGDPNLIGLKVRDAWVESGSTSEIRGSGRPDNRIIDMDNCTSPLPIHTRKTMSISYMHDVYFQTNVNPIYDLGIVALKASTSLGFTQGQIEIEEAVIDIDVPAGVHKRYMTVWQEVWETGIMSIDLGQERVQLPFRARKGMDGHQETFEVGCP